MNDTFFAYLHRLELMAFFSGYPLIYALVFFIAGNRPSKNNLKGRVVSLLPYSYALVGALYMGLQLKNLYPFSSTENLRQSIHQPFLMGWAIMALLFWIPAIAKRPALSLLHSLVFFLLLVKDIFFQVPDLAADNNIIRNDMKLYTDSLLLNITCLVAVTLIYFLRRWLGVNYSSPGIK